MEEANWWDMDMIGLGEALSRMEGNHREEALGPKCETCEYAEHRNVYIGYHRIG